MKRLLLAVHNAEAGGAQLLALADARRLARDFELTISIPEGSLRADFAEYGELVGPTSVLPIWGASSPRWTLQSTRTVRDSVRLARLIRRRGIELVLVNSTVLMAPVLAARLAGVPAIVHVREFPMTSGGRRVFGLHRRLADTLIAISGAVEDELPRGGDARLVRILAGIDIPERGGDPRDDFQKPVRLCVVGSVNGAHSKGQDVAVGALGWLVDQGVDASLDLVGPISDESFAAELRESAARLGVADRVHIRGESRETDAVFAATDIVLMCSRIEPLGLVPAEALVRGRPVIAARTGGLPEVIADGETGILVPPEDPEALGGAVLRMISSPTETREMIARGRRDVERRLNLEKSLDLIGEEVTRALERRGPA
ncbi:MAG TPA: glycosyltransferase family 4 protein [Solirubrobacterales bacterium]|nr:glycosyltransferase family 4 protein [Solirubrobacterales bacterium]